MESAWSFPFSSQRRYAKRGPCRDVGRLSPLREYRAQWRRPLNCCSDQAIAPPREARPVPGVVSRPDCRPLRVQSLKRKHAGREQGGCDRLADQSAKVGERAFLGITQRRRMGPLRPHRGCAPYQKNEQRLVWGVIQTIQLLLVRDCGAEELPRKQRQSQSKRFANR